MTTETVVLTAAQLHELVEVVSAADTFVFDVETRGYLSQNPDLAKLMEEELTEHLATLRSQTDAAVTKSRERYEIAYAKQIALDPKRNDLFWIGLAIEGHSWAIPLGHPLGEVIEPEEVGDGTTVPPEGYRKILKSGKESMAKARYRKPAVYGQPPAQLSRDVVLEALRPLFFSDRRKVGHNVKFDVRTVGKYYGEIPPGPYGDTMLAAHVLDENLMSYGLEKLIAHHFDGAKPYEAEGKVGKNITEVAFDVAARYLHLDVGWTWRLYQKLRGQIDAEGFTGCFEIEMEVLRILMEMEDAGVLIDREAMERLGVELRAELTRLRAEIEALSYPGFNPDSTPEKAKLLFETLGLTSVKETKGGAASTDKESLEKLADQHPIIPLILEWQSTTKMLGTYVDGLLPKLNNGRLHGSFNLHRTATGRLSGSEPNLQNIPAHSDVGQVIRGMFVADEGYELLVADYAAVEMRIFAMFSQDRELIRLFREGIDLHAGTAALVFEKPVEEVTKAERAIGKMSNFLSGYGGGKANLANKAGISLELAGEVLDGYYRQFAGLAAWKRKVVREARRDGYVTCLSGRRRRLPELYWKDNTVRARAERQAVNFLIQGTASDICKRAMIEVDRLIEGTPARLLLQVHDELVMTAPIGDTDYYANLLTKGMGHGTVIAGVPLVVDCHAAHSWAEAKG